MSANADFLPDWVSPPGDTIEDLLDEQGISTPEFANQLGRSETFAQSLLRGQETLTSDVALSVAKSLGGSANFWLNREAQYRVALARTSTAVEAALRDFPINDMVKLGWIPNASDQFQLLGACLRFFGVPDFKTLREVHLDAPQLVAFRTSPTFPSEAGAVAAWLRRGETLSQGIDCAPWNPRLLKNTLTSIRSLTRKKDPNVFLPELRILLAKCGVAFVAARAPGGCRASGATRFLSPTKALLLLSFRYLSDDHFWFSLFHEIGHLLLHGKDATFVDGADTVADHWEDEANAFAANTLIPPEHKAQMLALPLHGMAVIRFARSIGIAPGIVVGQLQHVGRFTRRQLNSLKRRYKWRD